MSSKGQRDSSIELLRVLAAAGVIVLHFNNGLYTNGLGLSVGINHAALTLLQGCFVCAVDLFVLISGYFLVASPRRSLWKPLGLLVETSCVQIAMRLSAAAFRGGGLSLRSLVGAALPNSYFVILYCATYILSPWVNLLFSERKASEVDLMMVALLAVLSMWPCAVDVLAVATRANLDSMSGISMQGSLDGYSLPNFLLMYCIGAWFRLRVDATAAARRHWGAVFAGIACAIAGLRLLAEAIGRPEVALAATTYCSPLVVAAAGCAFMAARSLELGHVGWVNRLAGASFMVYLINIPLVSRLPGAWTVSLPTPAMLMALAVEVASVYLVLVKQ